MSYTVVLSVLALALALGSTIGIMVWWVRRPISGRRADGAAALPLFGHEHGSLWSRADEEDAEPADMTALRTARTPPVLAGWLAVESGHETRGYGFARAVGGSTISRRRTRFGRMASRWRCT